jgi:hypothetical protein
MFQIYFLYLDTRNLMVESIVLVDIFLLSTLPLYFSIERASKVKCDVVTVRYKSSMPFSQVGLNSCVMGTLFASVTAN